jgi:hypothetical protein
MAHLFCNFKKKREAPKIRKNELHGKSIEKNQNEGFHSCHNASLYSSSIPSMALQDLAKERNTQRRRRFHNTPLNLPEIDFQMPNIPIEIFSTFFGDASKDAEQHLVVLMKMKMKIPNYKKKISECILISKNPQPRIDFIELWFQSIVGQTTQSNLHHTWYNFSPVHIESALDSLIQVPLIS